MDNYIFALWLFYLHWVIYNDYEFQIAPIISLYNWIELFTYNLSCACAHTPVCPYAHMFVLFLLTYLSSIIYTYAIREWKLMNK